jgi:hypothetical protein
MIHVRRSHLAIFISAVSLGLLLLQPRLACAVDGSSPPKVKVSPTVESVFDTLAFIRWTTQNPGGTILHFAVVHYGRDPNHLDLKAESPTRINPSHSEMVFRVRMDDLEPGTTYYYTVSSRQADGILDPVTSAVNQFTTRPVDWISTNK